MKKIILFFLPLIFIMVFAGVVEGYGTENYGEGDYGIVEVIIPVTPVVNSGGGDSYIMDDTPIIVEDDSRVTEVSTIEILPVGSVKRGLEIDYNESINDSIEINTTLKTINTNAGMINESVDEIIPEKKYINYNTFWGILLIFCIVVALFFYIRYKIK